jgi:hypothetical protein
MSESKPKAGCSLPFVTSDLIDFPSFDRTIKYFKHVSLVSMSVADTSCTLSVLDKVEDRGGWFGGEHENREDVDDTDDHRVLSGLVLRRTR